MPFPKATLDSISARLPDTSGLLELLESDFDFAQCLEDEESDEIPSVTFQIREIVSRFAALYPLLPTCPGDRMNVNVDRDTIGSSCHDRNQKAILEQEQDD